MSIYFPIQELSFDRQLIANIDNKYFINKLNIIRPFINMGIILKAFLINKNNGQINPISILLSAKLILTNNTQ